MDMMEIYRSATRAERIIGAVTGTGGGNVTSRLSVASDMLCVLLLDILGSTPIKHVLLRHKVQ